MQNLVDSLSYAQIREALAKPVVTGADSLLREFLARLHEERTGEVVRLGFGSQVEEVDAAFNIDQRPEPPEEDSISGFFNGLLAVHG